MSPAPATVKSTTPVKDKDEWRTDPVIFNLLNREFQFHLDVAATDENALCEYYYTKEDNSLEQPWYDPADGITRIYCNPPFSLAGDFLLKGREEAKKGATCVFLVRADAPETKWWCNGVLDTRKNGYTVRGLYRAAYEVRNLSPRLTYLRPDGTPVSDVLFPSAVVIMGPKIRPNVFWWKWKEVID